LTEDRGSPWRDGASLALHVGCTCHMPKRGASSAHVCLSKHAAFSTLLVTSQPHSLLSFILCAIALLSQLASPSYIVPTTCATAMTSTPVESYTEMKGGDVEAVGAHCQMEYCHVLDFLPFRCQSCKGYPESPLLNLSPLTRPY
jgi:hypothetical protein